MKCCFKNYVFSINAIGKPKAVLSAEKVLCDWSTYKDTTGYTMDLNCTNVRFVIQKMNISPCFIFILFTIHLFQVCDKDFSRSDHLKKHSLIHSGIKPFCCQVIQSMQVTNSLNTHIDPTIRRCVWKHSVARITYGNIFKPIWKMKPILNLLERCVRGWMTNLWSEMNQSLRTIEYAWNIN